MDVPPKRMSALSDQLREVPERSDLAHAIHVAKNIQPFFYYRLG
jgi:hypothetical protein